jgi:hypothetical protein
LHQGVVAATAAVGIGEFADARRQARRTEHHDAAGDRWPRTDYRDELLPGFFLRITPEGSRTLGFVYTTRDGRLRRCTVGPLGLPQARAQAKRLRGAVAQGEDLHGDRMTARRKKPTAATVEDLVEAFLASKDALAWRPPGSVSARNEPNRGGAAEGC